MKFLKQLINFRKNARSFECCEAFREEELRRFRDLSEYNEKIINEKIFSIRQLRNNKRILVEKGFSTKDMELHIPAEQLEILRDIYSSMCREVNEISFDGIPIVVDDKISRFIFKIKDNEVALTPEEIIDCARPFQDNTLLKDRFYEGITLSKKFAKGLRDFFEEKNQKEENKKNDKKRKSK